MATTISKLAILLSLNSQGVTSGVADASKRLDQFDKKIGNLGKNSFAQLGNSAQGALSRMASSFTATIGSVIAVERVVSGLADAYERVGLRSKRASQLGSSVNELGGLEFALGQGTQIDGAGTFDALRAFNKRISDAKDPANELAKALDRIGLSAQRLEKLTLTDRVRTIGEAIRQLPAAEDRAAVSAKFFEETGSNIVALFNQGDGAMMAFMADYEHLHGALSATDVEGMRVATAAMGRLWTAIEGSFERLASELGPHLADELNRMAEAVAGFRGGMEGIGATFNSVKGFLKDFGSIATLIGGPQTWGFHYLWAQTDFMSPSAGISAPAGAKSDQAAKQIEKLGAAADDAAKAMEMAEKAAIAEWERGVDAGEALRQSLLTPMEAFREEVERFQMMALKGFIGNDTRDRAIADAEKKLADSAEKTAKVARRDLGIGPIGLAERGTAAAFSAERAGQTQLKTLADNSAKALVLDQKLVESMEQLDRTFRETGEIKLVFEPIL